MARRIVLVDDSEDDRFLVQRALGKLKQPPDLLVFRDGLAACHYFSSVSSDDLPSLVILDVKLPVTSGFEVLEHIRCRPETHSLDVVVMSSSDEPEDIERALRLGASEYTAKAVSPEEFISSIQALVDAYLS